MADNPLAEAQRESAGANTFGKYNFQFHWALCEIIKKHEQKKEYAVLIEYHEDVVIADTLNSDLAKFEFYQVKNQKAKFTPDSLTKRNKGKGELLKNSVLGKLLSSCNNKSYENRIERIGLVSSSGFSLDTDNNLKLDVIKVGDIAEDDINTLTENIYDELGIKVLPECLQFIVPEVQLLNQEDYVLSGFARLVDKLFPGAMCNAVSIYRAVIDEMGRIGRLEFDYKDWDRLIEKKSLTSSSVHEVITQHSTHPCVNDIKNDFDDLARDLSWSSIKKRPFKRDLSLLALKRAGFMSALDIEITKSFTESNKKIYGKSFESELAYVNALEEQALRDGLLDKVQGRDEMMMEIVYCLLKG